MITDVRWICLTTFRKELPVDLDTHPWSVSRRRVRGHYYAKAQNLRRQLAEAYDEALADVDVLAMPTTPQTAHEQQDDLSRLEVIDRALNMLPNTAPFDVTGHPALSVPAGESGGLPVGLMFVGAEFDDETVLQAGSAYEESVGWDLT